MDEIALVPPTPPAAPFEIRTHTSQVFLLNGAYKSHTHTRRDNNRIGGPFECVVKMFFFFVRSALSISVLIYVPEGIIFSFFFFIMQCVCVFFFLCTQVGVMNGRLYSFVNGDTMYI